MGRSDAASYLAVMLDDLLATAGMTGDDDAPNLGFPLDAADRGMTRVAIPETDVAARESAYTALARYHVLLRIRDKVAGRFSVSTGGDTYQLQQSLAGVEKLLAEARTDALYLAGTAAVLGGTGADVVPAAAGIGAIELDWSGGDVVADEYEQGYVRW